MNLQGAALENDDGTSKIKHEIEDEHAPFSKTMILTFRVFWKIPNASLFQGKTNYN